MTDAQADGFLSRWSRLKTALEIETAELQQVDLPPLAEQPLTERVGAVSAEGGGETLADTQVESEVDAARLVDAEVVALTDADMPDIDTLGEESDFSGFLSEKVSEHLRRKALQKLFHLPEFNLRDGLNEYDEDYSTFVPLGDTITYQMKQFIERQKQDFKDALEDDPDAVVAVDLKAVDSDPRAPADTAQVKAVEEDDLGNCE